jgi:hypothetical protein
LSKRTIVSAKICYGYRHFTYHHGTCCLFSNGFVHGNLVVQGDASATFDNITSSKMLFKAEIFGWLIILIIDIVVAWAFYIFLEPIHKSLSLLGAWLRLAYAAILGMAIMNLIVVLLLSEGTDEGGRSAS